MQPLTETNLKRHKDMEGPRYTSSEANMIHHSLTTKKNSATWTRYHEPPASSSQYPNPSHSIQRSSIGTSDGARPPLSRRSLLPENHNHHPSNTTTEHKKQRPISAIMVSTPTLNRRGTLNHRDGLLLAKRQQEEGQKNMMNHNSTFKTSKNETIMNKTYTNHHDIILRVGDTTTSSPPHDLVPQLFSSSSKFNVPVPSSPPPSREALWSSSSRRTTPFCAMPPQSFVPFEDGAEFPPPLPDSTPGRNTTLVIATKLDALEKMIAQERGLRVIAEERIRTLNIVRMQQQSSGGVRSTSSVEDQHQQGRLAMKNESAWGVVDEEQSRRVSVNDGRPPSAHGTRKRTLLSAGGKVRVAHAPF